MISRESTAEFASDGPDRNLSLTSSQSLPVSKHVETLQLWERPALASGILFVVLQLGALLYFTTLVFPQMGPPGAVAQKMAFYTEHGEILRWGNYLLMLPTPLFLFFLGGLSSLLRRSEGSSRVLTTTVISSGTLVAVLWPLSAVVNNIGIDIAQAGGDVATIVALDAIGPYMLALSALPRTVLLVTTAIALMHGPLTPPWLGWLGMGLGVLSVFGSATLVLVGLFPVLALSTLLFELWILVLSITFLFRASKINGLYLDSDRGV